MYEHKVEHEQKTIDLNFEQSVNNIMQVLEFFNVDDVVENYKEVVGPNSFVIDSCHHELESYYFMYSLEGKHEREFSNQLMFYDIVEVFDSPVYDEYVGDYDTDLIEQPTVGILSESDSFQIINDNFQPTYHNLKFSNRESSEPTGGDSLRL